MDNLPAHEVEVLRETIETVGAELRYLPPYSPDLSPIEQSSRKAKGASAHFHQARPKGISTARPLRSPVSRPAKGTGTAGSVKSAPSRRTVKWTCKVRSRNLV